MIKNLIIQSFIITIVSLVLVNPIFNQMVSSDEVELCENELDNSTDDVEEEEIEELYCSNTNLLIIESSIEEEDENNSLGQNCKMTKSELDVPIPPPKG